MTNRWFALAVLLAVGVIVAVAGGSLAHAELGQPMTFRLIAANGGVGPAIEADGDFAADTPARFAAFLAANRITASLPPHLRPTVFFTSEGGDLGAGLQMGRIIRRYNFDTSVGAHVPVPEALRLLLAQNYRIIVNEDCRRSSVLELPNSCRLDRDAGQHASYCVSACTIAFLGGVTRSMVEGSSYAVHQFAPDCKRQPGLLCTDASAAMAVAQMTSAQIASYLEEMGIPSGFLTDMVLADPAHVNVLSNDTLLKYNIVYTDRTAKWDVKGTAGGLALVYEQHVRGSNSSVEFNCTRRGSSAELILQTIGDHYDDRANALSAHAIQFQYLPAGPAPGGASWREFPLLPDEIVRSPYPAQGAGVGLVLRATPRMIDALRKADSFWIMSDLGAGASISYASARLDKDKLDGYIAGCH